MRKMGVYDGGRLRLSEYRAPTSTSIPNMMMANGQISTFCAIRPDCCASVMMPQKSTIRPMAMPTIAPPCGSPKHSCSARLRSHLRDW